METDERTRRGWLPIGLRPGAVLDPAERRRRLAAVLATAALLVVVTALVPRTPQPTGYHDFADSRTWLGVPNAGDVLSNLPFLLIGLWGLWVVPRLRVGPGGSFAAPHHRGPWLAFFAALATTGVGSAWYHHAPDHWGLFWDRLPLSLCFTAILAAALVERVEGSFRRWWWTLLPLGPLAAGWWIASEELGRGDVRWYVLVQVAPLVLVPLAVLLLPARTTRGGDWLGVLLFYGAAKLGELLDAEILAATGVVSGHSLKHLAAAAVGWWLLRMLGWRRVVSPSAQVR